MNYYSDIIKNFETEGKLTKAKIFVAHEVETDPFKHTKRKDFLNLTTIKVLVSTESFEALRWKYYGQIPTGSIKCIAEKKYLNLFKLADKIQINEEFYYCYKDDSKNFLILPRTDYIVVVLAIKNLSESES